MQKKEIRLVSPLRTPEHEFRCHYDWATNINNQEAYGVNTTKVVDRQ